MYNTEKRLDEVNFANHLKEFIRFYDKHKTLSDEITGIRKKVIVENNQQSTFEITKFNFEFAIKRLNAFIIDNIHYIKDKYKRIELETRIEKLESRFVNDSEYSKYVSNKDKLSTDDRIKFNIIYFKYIVDCFELSHDLCIYLQTSLMLSTNDIKKSLRYYDTKQFFENLSRYRDEMSNDLSEFKFSTVLTHFKRILGYHYTYRILISKKELFFIDDLINLIFTYLLSDENISLIIEVEENRVFDERKKIMIREITLFIKKVFSTIYKLTNGSLSDKNILPKIDKKILIDKTLI